MLLLQIRHGRVLEIGFGAGANLVCLANRTGITHYQSIEPNENFASHIDATVKRAVAASAEQRLPFPLAIDRGYAEALPYEDESFDFVFSTHVLCSVDNVPDALREIHRVLKRGGQFVFLEHVLASPDADPWRRSVQDAIEPGEQEGVVLLFFLLLLLLLLCFDDECLSLFLLGFFFLFLA